MENATLNHATPYNMTEGCPNTLPENWVCREQQDTLLVLMGPRVNLTDAYLGDADFATPGRVDLSEATLHNVDFSLSTLNANFNGASLNTVNFTDTNLSNSTSNEETTFTGITFSSGSKCPNGANYDPVQNPCFSF